MRREPDWDFIEAQIDERILERLEREEEQAKQEQEKQEEV